MIFSNLLHILERVWGLEFPNLGFVVLEQNRETMVLIYRGRCTFLEANYLWLELRFFLRNPDSFALGINGNGTFLEDTLMGKLRILELY